MDVLVGVNTVSVGLSGSSSVTSVTSVVNGRY